MILPVDYEEELNQEQRTVVMADDGPMLVIAGAGSGKTRTITYRMARLIERGVPPYEVMLATFTNKAAREMLHRVECLLGISLERLWGGTFHHIGNLILRREAKKIGYHNNYTIMDREDQKDLVDVCVNDMGIDTRTRRFPKSDVVVNIITLSRNTMKDMEDIVNDSYSQFQEWSGHIRHLAQVYQEKKHSLNLMDYDDLLCFVWGLFREDERTRRKYGEMFQHILVDEYQDTNRLQAEIVDLLGRDHQNVLVVGDDSQSIYAFRGADFENIIQFPRRYPDCRIYRLETNYRSTPQILDMANQVIVHNTRQFEKTLRAVRESGPKPAVVPLPNVFSQAEFVASHILKMREEEGYDLEDMAVLYRAHYQSMEVQLELTRRGIPFEIRSGLRFFEQAHVKDVLAYLKVVANPRDEIAWKRVLKMYPRVGKATAEKIWQALSEYPDPIALFGEQTLPHFIPGRLKDSYFALGELLQQLEKVGFSPSEMIQETLNGGYAEYMKVRFANPVERLQDLEELAHYATRYDSLDAFLSELALLGEVEAENLVEAGMKDEKITLSSVHQAKGLEWKVVFVVWLVEGGFPSGRSMSSERDVEEERRLFYVASTRAKNRLFLCYPLMSEGSRASGSYLRKPSRFLTELSPAVVHKMFVDRKGKMW